MIEGNFVLTPAAIVAVAWLAIAVRRGFGPWTAAVGLVAIGHFAAVVAVTLFPLPVQAEVIEEHRAAQLASNNLVPFVSLVNAVASGGYPAVISQSVGNFLMLAPFSVYAPLLLRRLRPFHLTMLAGLAFSLLVEASQLAISTVLGFTYKIADVDDVILNTAGVAVGYVGFLVLRIAFEEAEVEVLSAEQSIDSTRV
jgi:glycopeptide antibiotics resistance protein